MSFPIKSHLPLITTRIEFKYNLLPPPPQITNRRDFGAHIRRQARHKSVPYSRPRHRKKTPARAQSVGFNHRSESESSLSELSDSEQSDQEESVGLIPKPPGEAGKGGSGGFNLAKALGWDQKRYEEFTVSLHC